MENNEIENSFNTDYEKRVSISLDPKSLIEHMGNIIKLDNNTLGFFRQENELIFGHKELEKILNRYKIILFTYFFVFIQLQITYSSILRTDIFLRIQ